MDGIPWKCRDGVDIELSKYASELWRPHYYCSHLMLCAYCHPFFFSREYLNHCRESEALAFSSKATNYCIGNEILSPSVRSFSGRRNLSKNVAKNIANSTLNINLKIFKEGIPK
jgi:hypothetical protein